MAMAAFATVAIEQAILEPGRPRGIVVLGTAGLLIAPEFAMSYVLARLDRRAAVPAVGARSTSAVLLALLTVFALPLAADAVRLVATGRRPMPEVIFLTALRNLGLSLAAVAYRPLYARLSAIVGLFLVIVASPIGGEAGFAVMAPVVGFTIVGTYWLMLVYWVALGSGSRTGADANRFPLMGAAWVIGVVVMTGAIAMIGPTRAATALMALAPTSGGTDWSDPDARSGVGDGDHEVSASDHPESVGFTESEAYLETDRPSLYDAFTESYGEPFRPKRTEKMIALEPQANGEQKQRPSENLQAGREFAAIRRAADPRLRRPAEHAAKALVYVKGPTPLHLPLAAYSHFDGATWREEPCCNRHFPAELEQGSSWLRLPWSESPYLAGVVSHQIKVGTLNSSALPLPPHPARFRVGSVNRVDFFNWAQFGIVRMTDRTVPAGTRIDSEARTVDHEALRALSIAARASDDIGHYISFHGSYTVAPAVATLARDWAGAYPEGWNQIEAVVAALRQHYRHDRGATAPAGCTDVVAEFLLHSRRGPDYLFASSAVVLIRSLGYPARVVSGLYAAPGRYDPRTHHTPVTRDDVHFWAEVLLPNGHWVAIEPTPGYESLPPVRPWYERAVQTLAAFGRWGKRHATGLGVLTFLFTAALAWRRELADAIATWSLVIWPARDPREHVLRTLGLVERRARWAGRQRPAAATPTRWYLPLLAGVAREPRIALQTLITLADWAVHAPESNEWPLPISRRELEQNCRITVESWTLTRFRSLNPKSRTRGIMA
jgi:hypothetical protein